MYSSLLQNSLAQVVFSLICAELQNAWIYKTPSSNNKKHKQYNIWKENEKKYIRIHLKHFHELLDLPGLFYRTSMHVSRFAHRTAEAKWDRYNKRRKWEKKRKGRWAASEEVGFVIVAGEWWRGVKRLNCAIREGIRGEKKKLSNTRRRLHKGRRGGLNTN